VTFRHIRGLRDALSNFASTSHPSLLRLPGRGAERSAERINWEDEEPGEDYLLDLAACRVLIILSKSSNIVKW
jgi:hypothetical protein